MNNTAIKSESYQVLHTLNKSLVQKYRPWTTNKYEQITYVLLKLKFMNRMGQISWTENKTKCTITAKSENKKKTKCTVIAKSENKKNN